MIGFAEIEIIDILFEKGIKNIDDLSSELNRSERTIKYSLDKLNEFFNDFYKDDIVSIEGQNIKLLKSPNSISKVLNNIDRNHYYLSIEERIELGSFQYLAGLNFTMDELANFMNISLSTLKQTMPMIRATLNKYELSLVNVPRIGLEVQGEERIIRKYLAKYLYKNLYFSCNSNEKKVVLYFKTNPYFKELLKIYLEGVPVVEIIEIMDSFEAEYSIFKNDELYKLALADLIVIYKRNLIEQPLTTNRELSVIEKDKAKFLRNAFIEKIGLNLSEKEFYDFVSYLSKSSSGSKIPIDILLTDMLNKLIDKYIKNEDLDLSHPRITEAISIFNRHFYFATDRIQKDIYIENPLLDEIKASHELLFNDIKSLLKDIEKCIGKKFSENEIGYFTILIENILSVIVSENKQTKNIVVVCGMGYGTSKLLSNKISRYFKVNVVNVIPYHKLDLIPMDNVDLIITTVPLTQKIKGIEVVKVSPLLTNVDMEILRKAGLMNKKFSDVDSILSIIQRNCIVKDNKRLQSELDSFLKGEIEEIKKSKYDRLLSFIKIRNISLNEKVSNWKEAIEIAGILLVKNGSVDISYVADMIKNIETYGPYMIMSNGLAMPHAENKGNIIKTDFSLITLEEPIKFNDNKLVKTVFCFSSIDGIEHIDILIDFMNLVENDNLLDHIEQFKYPDELIEFIASKG